MRYVRTVAPAAAGASVAEARAQGVGKATDDDDLVEALVRHISESLDNISVPAVENLGSFDFAPLPFSRTKRHKPSHVLPGW